MSRGARGGLAAGVLAAAALVLLLPRDRTAGAGDGAAPVVPSPGTAAPRTSEVEAAPLAAAEPGPGPDAEAASDAGRAVFTPPRSWARVPIDAPHVRVSGIVVLVDDASEDEHALEDPQPTEKDGYVTLSVDERVGVVLATFSEGRFTVELPLGARVAADVVDVEGNAYVGLLPCPTSGVVVDRETRLVIVAAEERSVILHVAAAESGAPLDDVRVVRVESGWADLEAVDPRDERAAESWHALGPSPVALTSEELLPATPDSEEEDRDRDDLMGIRLLVTAPGRVAKCVEVSFLRDRELRVVLERGAELGISFEGTPLPDDAILNVTWPDASPELTTFLDRSTRTLRLAGLPATPVSMEVLGIGWRVQGVLFAHAEASLAAGETTWVPLHLQRPEDVPRAPFEGTLVVPSGWLPGDQGILCLVASPADRAHVGPADLCRAAVFLRRDTESDTWTGAFSLDDAPVGSCRLVCDEILWGGTTISVPPQGTSGARVELPAPAVLTVHAVDEGDGSPLGGVEVWCEPDGGTQEAVLPITSFDDGRFRTRVVPGPYRVWLGGPWSSRPRSEVEHLVLPAGETEITLEAPPWQGARVRLVCAGELVPFEGSLRAVPLDPDGRAVEAEAMRMPTDRSLVEKVYLDRPGRWRLEPARLAGLEQVEPCVVDVPAGAWVDVAIELVPRDG